MISEQEFRKISEKVFELSSAEETEITLGGGHENLTRYGENRITQNVSEERYEMRIRVRQGQKVGVATSNDLSDESLKRCLDEALGIALVAAEDDTVQPFAKGDSRSESEAWDADTAQVSADTRADWVAEAVDIARSKDMEVGGIALDREGTIYDYGEIGPFGVANCGGLFRYGQLTSAAFEISAQKGEGAGRARKSSRKVSEIDAGAVARDACERAEAALNPQDLDPGKYTVIFEAEAVTDLAFFTGYLGFNGLNVAEGRSPLADKLGEKVFGENITFREDPGHPDLHGLTFDAEGVDTRKMDLIRDGVVSGFYHDRRSAKICGHEPTGHALSQPNSWGAFARFPVLDGGEASLDEMVAGLDRGVLVTRLWYTNVVDPMRMIVTGMTRDGTFLVEEGKIVGAVKNFRFNQSLLDFFQNVEQLGQVQDLGGTLLPHLRVKDFNFSSSTDF